MRPVAKRRTMSKFAGIEFNNGSGGGGSDATAGTGSLADQLVNSALRYRAQAPLLDSLMRELGLEGSDINGLTAALGNASETPSGSEGDSAG